MVVLGTSIDGAVMIVVDVRGATAARFTSDAVVDRRAVVRGGERDGQGARGDEDGGTGGEAQNRAHDRFASAIPARH